MIDRTHDLPITRQARALNISRGFTCRARCRKPTLRSCGALTGFFAAGCCDACWLPRGARSAVVP